jgi:hypothetical protein
MIRIGRVAQVILEAWKLSEIQAEGLSHMG